MKLRIDGRFIALQALGCIACYALGVLIVFAICDVNDPVGFIGASFIAATALYSVYFYPRAICINDGVVSIKKQNSWKRIKVRLSDIVSAETRSNFYNTVTITTKLGDTYQFHPKDAQAFMNALN